MIAYIEDPNLMNEDNIQVPQDKNGKMESS